MLDRSPRRSFSTWKLCWHGQSTLPFCAKDQSTVDSNVELNPYSSTSQCGEHGPPTASLLFSVLLVIAAMNLLWHGALMVWGYFEQFANLPSSVSIFASNFFLAIILKDCIAGGTALLAAILIFCRHRIGWWMAVIHWHWYLTWNAIIVFAAESFAWRLPARYERAEIVRQMVICLIYSIVAIAFLTSNQSFAF